MGLGEMRLGKMLPNPECNYIFYLQDSLCTKFLIMDVCCVQNQVLL